jgi:hypothetical protein
VVPDFEPRIGQSLAGLDEKGTGVRVLRQSYRSIWPVAWLCRALGMSRSNFHASLGRQPNSIPVSLMKAAQSRPLTVENEGTEMPSLMAMTLQSGRRLVLAVWAASLAANEQRRKYHRAMAALRNLPGDVMARTGVRRDQFPVVATRVACLDVDLETALKGVARIAEQPKPNRGREAESDCDRACTRLAA